VVLDRLEGSRACLFTFHRVAGAAEWDILPDRDCYIDADYLDSCLPMSGGAAGAW
jgi:hypothetical protein